MKPFSMDFRKTLVDAAAPSPRKLCPRCFPHDHHVDWMKEKPRVLTVAPGTDIRPMYALAIAARVSYACDVATTDLGWDLPWKQTFVVHVVHVPTEAGVVRILAEVGGDRHADNFEMTTPNLAFERWCQDIALKLVDKHVPEGLTPEEAKAALDAQLKLRWPEADFHTCGRSVTPAVKRIVDGYEKAWR